MQWYKEVIGRIDGNRVYSRKELISELKMLKSDVSESTYHWAVTRLVRDGILIKLGYDSYTFSSNLPYYTYTPLYSEKAEELIRVISEKLPYIRFTVFETVLMNEFLNHLVAQNTAFVQVEKDSSIYVFRYLQEIGYKNVLYKPDNKEFDLYWTRDCVIVTDMISEAPLRTDMPHSIMLEKMLVDMSADKLIASAFSKSEFPDIMEQAQSRYRLDKVRMMRYARRRNRQDVIRKYLQGEKML